MKILWFSHFLPYPPRGGAKQRSYNLIKEAAGKHKVYLFAINHDAGNTAEAIDALKKFCYGVKIIDLPADRSFKYFRAVSNLFSIIPYTAFWLQSEEIRLSIRQILKKDVFDLAHFDSIDACGYLKEANNMLKVLNHHNIESQMMFRRSLKDISPLKKLYFFWEALRLRNYEKKVCPQFNYNLTVSELDKERLLRISSKAKVEVVENGVDTEYFQAKGDNIEPYSLIFAGRLEWYPNRDAIMFFAKKIWPLLKKEIPQVKITVIGDNPPGYILRLSRKDPSFIVTGFVEDVRPYLEKAQVYICPIRDGGGTKLKILDALAMAKPVVAHPVAIEGIAVEPEKHLLLAETPQEFVRQIKRLFEDFYLRGRLAKEARRLAVEKYDFKQIGAKLSALYNKINRSL